MTKHSEKLLKLLRKGVNYRRAIKVAKWDAGHGRFTRIARAAGFRLVSKRLPDRDVHMQAIPRARKAKKAA